MSAYTSQQITYTPRDADGAAAVPQKVTCTVTPYEAEPAEVALSSEAGVYRGTYTPQRDGVHRVRLEATYPGGAEGTPALVDVRVAEFTALP